MKTITVTEAAAVAHEANRTYCQALGDLTQPSWSHAPAWQRESAMAGVRFHLANPGASPSASHDSWLKQKLEDGWKWGPTKDPEKKEHPCIVPFDKLPAEQQAKDRLFASIVSSLRTLIRE